MWIICRQMVLQGKLQQLVPCPPGWPMWSVRRQDELYQLASALAVGLTIQPSHS